MKVMDIDLAGKSPAKIAVFVLLMWLVNCIGMICLIAIFTPDLATMVIGGAKAGTVFSALEAFIVALFAALEWATNES